MRRAEVENALRQEDRLRVNTPNGPGWVHGPLDDSGSVRVGFDDGTSGKVQIGDLERPRQPRPADRNRGPRPPALPNMGRSVMRYGRYRVTEVPVSEHILDWDDEE